MPPCVCVACDGELKAHFRVQGEPLYNKELEQTAVISREYKRVKDELLKSKGVLALKRVFLSPVSLFPGPPLPTTHTARHTTQHDTT
jgi:hypothetical protein